MTPIAAALPILFASAVLCATGCGSKAPSPLAVATIPPTALLQTPPPVVLESPAPASVKNIVSSPTAADVEIGRNAISISEVSLMMRGGEREKDIISAIRHRHIPVRLTTPVEQEFVAKGGSSELIAALKDEQNILTANQVPCYEQNTADRKSRVERSVRATQEQIAKREVPKASGPIIVARDSRLPASRPAPTPDRR